MRERKPGGGRRKGSLGQKLGRALTNTERSQIRRAKIKADQARQIAERLNAHSVATSTEVATKAYQDAIEKSPLPKVGGDRLSSRKYHPDRPATAAERKQKWKEKQAAIKQEAQRQQNYHLQEWECDKCGHKRQYDSVIIFIKCQSCSKGRYVNPQWKNISTDIYNKSSNRKTANNKEQESDEPGED